MDTLEQIKQEATRRGACRLAYEPSDWQGMARLLFSPQGKEFVKETGYPTLEAFREAKPYVANLGVCVDSGAVAEYNEENIALVGKTRADLAYEGAEAKHTVILMHGAEARIIMRHYAVVEVVNAGGEAKIDKDETSILL